MKKRIRKIFMVICLTTAILVSEVMPARAFLTGESNITQVNG